MEYASFVVRNSKLLNEGKHLLEQDLESLDCLGQSYNREGGSRFYRLGSFESSYLNRRVFAGLKRLSRGFKTVGDCQRDLSSFSVFLNNWALLDFHFPQVRDKLPLFMGLAYKGGVFEGLFMEDYSCGGEKEVIEFPRYNSLDFPDPEELLKRGLDDLKECCVLVDGELRLLDLGAVPWKRHDPEFIGKGQKLLVREVFHRVCV